MQTLIKLDSKDKLRVLEIWTEGPELKQRSGLLDGGLVTNTRVCTPKNVGRANEVSAADQAISEMESKINKKLDETYVKVPQEINLDTATEDILRNLIKANVTEAPKAMLAKTYVPRYATWDVGVFASPKLDGARAMAPLGQLWSRGGKQITTMNHIIEELRPVLSQAYAEGVILDGELYYHDKSADNFQDIMRAVKKYRPGVSEQVEYWVYDIVSPSGTAAWRMGLIHGLLEGLKHVKVVPQYLCSSEKDAFEYHDKFLGEGYEGTMLKNAMSQYKGNARSSDLLKLKDFMDSEFPIVDVVPMDNRPECGVVVLEVPGAGRFKATPKASYAERAEMLRLKHEYIGKAGTVQYFSLTNDGIPRFPVFKSVHGI